MGVSWLKIAERAIASWRQLYPKPRPQARLSRSKPAAGFAFARGVNGLVGAPLIRLPPA